MDSALVELLVDPISAQPLRLHVEESDAENHVIAGHLHSAAGRSFPIVNGIPRLVVSDDDNQRQTGESFGFKWNRRASYDSPRFRSDIQAWLVARYGFATVDEMRKFFGGRRRIVDLGCGSGFTSSLWMEPSWRGDGDAEWIGVDLSTAIDVARDRLACMPGTHFVQADILHLPFRSDSFDTVYAEGVLHHTPSTERALGAAARVLASGGELLFYVYRRKAPLREFTDDYIRAAVSRLDPEQAWEAIRPITRLGKALADLHIDVEVSEDVPLLGIKAGRYDVQRLIYWHVAKLYWNDGFSLEENNHVNFDWYHPTYAHRHTEDEIRGWCKGAGLTIQHFDAQESGYTVRAIKG
ncbi:MAG TPA: methyltransferase domain-containing protein [Methylomirabilota bacterium]|nr:methyltransferase domain-containing protein [Methylomirabilota bacterium]